MSFGTRLLSALGLIALLSTLAACGREEPPAVAADSRPVKTVTVLGGSSGGARKYPGRIEASRRAELGFRVAGTIQEINVKEGENVEQDQVLARLDPTDYEIVLKDRQATFDNAERNFGRAKDLIVDGNISKLDYDRMEANFKTSSAALTAARQDLEYTSLKAPFAGRLARRHVENFEEVLAKQTVFTLTQIDMLDVKIDMPESVVRSLRIDRSEDPEDVQTRSDVIAYAEFEGTPDQKFDLVVKEVATKADSQTQTFEVTLTMPAPNDFVVLPGMTATVTLDLSQVSDTQELVWLPTTAVVADANLGSHVWIVQPDSMTVTKREVSIGSMEGNRIQVRSGLYAGDEVVAVGASYLAEGMRVTRMAQSEQAVPRPDDPN